MMSIEQGRRVKVCYCFSVAVGVSTDLLPQILLRVFCEVECSSVPLTCLFVVWSVRGLYQGMARVCFGHAFPLSAM